MSTSFVPVKVPFASNTLMKRLNHEPVKNVFRVLGVRVAFQSPLLIKTSKLPPSNKTFQLVNDANRILLSRRKHRTKLHKLTIYYTFFRVSLRNSEPHLNQTQTSKTRFYKLPAAAKVFLGLSNIEGKGKTISEMKDLKV